MHSFCWNGHSNCVMKNIKNLYEKNLFVDCTLYVEGESIEAHKNILAAVSPFFEHIFTDLPRKRNIVLEDVKFQDVKSVIDLIYHGRIEICQSRLSSFLDLVEMLELPEEALKLNGEKNQKEGCAMELVTPNAVCVVEDKKKEKTLKLRMSNKFVGCELDLPVINSDDCEARSVVNWRSMSSLMNQSCNRIANKAKGSHEDSKAKELSKERVVSIDDILKDVCGDTEMSGSSSVLSKLKRNSDADMDLGELSDIRQLSDDVMQLDALENCEWDDNDDEGNEPSSTKNKNSSKHSNDNDSGHREQFEPQEDAPSKFGVKRGSFGEILDVLQDFKEENRNLANKIIQNQCVLMQFISDKKGLEIAVDPVHNMKSYNLTFPMETLEEYSRFSKLLEEDSIFRESVSRLLVRCINRNHILPRSIVGMLKALMSKNLASSFCASKHTEKKLKMRDSPLCKLMIALIFDKRKACNMDTHEKDFNRYLSAVLTNVQHWSDNKKRKK